MRDVFFRAAVFRLAGFLAAAFLAGAFLAGAFFAAVFFVVVFFAVALAVVFRVAAFLAGAFFLEVVLVLTAFFPVDFFDRDLAVVDFATPVLRGVSLPDLLAVFLVVEAFFAVFFAGHLGDQFRHPLFVRLHQMAAGHGLIFPVGFDARLDPADEVSELLHLPAGRADAL